MMVNDYKELMAMCELAPEIKQKLMNGFKKSRCKNCKRENCKGIDFNGTCPYYEAKENPRCFTCQHELHCLSTDWNNTCTNYQTRIPETIAVNVKCDKCVWQHTTSCPGDPIHCDNYKRDPPDGGYYG